MQQRWCGRIVWNGEYVCVFDTCRVVRVVLQQVRCNPLEWVDWPVQAQLSQSFSENWHEAALVLEVPLRFQGRHRGGHCKIGDWAADEAKPSMKAAVAKGSGGNSEFGTCLQLLPAAVYSSALGSAAPVPCAGSRSLLPPLVPSPPLGAVAPPVTECGTRALRFVALGTAVLHRQAPIWDVRHAGWHPCQSCGAIPMRNVSGGWR